MARHNAASRAAAKIGSGRPRLHSARMAGAGCRPASHHGPSRPSRVPHHRAGLRSRRLAELGRGLSPRLRARGRTGTGAQGARGGRDKLLPSRRARASGPCGRQPHAREPRAGKAAGKAGHRGRSGRLAGREPQGQHRDSRRKHIQGTASGTDPTCSPTALAETPRARTS